MISGKLVYLRSVEAPDLDRWVEWFNEAEIIQFLNVVYPYSRLDAENFWKRTQQNAAEVLYSIVTQAEHKHIGSINLKKIDWRSRHAELGITLGIKEFWGRGYGNDAVETVCRFAFAEMGLHRVYLYVREDHEAGIRAYEKAGFKIEGRARQQLYRNGRYYDLILMGRLASDE
jgi:RimJ/RimL family protein N-acetyltransferase